jgi:hypothetical protein
MSPVTAARLSLEMEPAERRPAATLVSLKAVTVKPEMVETAVMPVMAATPSAVLLPAEAEASARQSPWSAAIRTQTIPIPRAAPRPMPRPTRPAATAARR